MVEDRELLVPCKFLLSEKATYLFPEKTQCHILTDLQFFSFEVGLNINPAETWSIALYSEFDTLDDVKFYAVHPDHVAAGKLIAEVKESRACVDYEV